jgi:hypothetical protein
LASHCKRSPDEAQRLSTAELVNPGYLLTRFLSMSNFSAKRRSSSVTTTAQGIP